MNRRRRAAAALARTFAAGLRNPRRGVRVLMYHSVAPQLERDPYGLNTTPQRFRSQMEHLATSHVNVTTVDRVGRGRSRLTSGCEVVITFDDGFAGIEKHVAPVMEELHLPFAVFATWEYLEDSSDRYLSKAGLTSLASLPLVTIGSHGLTHARLTEIDPESRRREVRESRARLRELLGTNVTSFAYPHGAVDAASRAEVADAGYAQAFSSRRGINTGRFDLYDLARTEITAEDDLRRFDEKIRGAWDWLGTVDRVRRSRFS